MIRPDIAKIERHAMLSDAHRTIVLGLKYPSTVAQSAIDQAQARIDACAELDAEDRRRRKEGALSALQSSTRVLPKAAA